MALVLLPGLSNLIEDISEENCPTGRVPRCGGSP